MGQLIYVTNTSVDGYIEDRTGAFDWLPPDEDVFTYCTELLRSAGTFLYGRRLYESMAVWETDPALAARSALMAEFARAWRAARKVVYSTTLTQAPTADTRIERHLDVDEVRERKAAAGSDLVIGGADLASQAVEAGLVDEVQLLVWPVVVGAGKPALTTRTNVTLELLDERRFSRSGVVLLRYRPLTG